MSRFLDRAAEGGYEIEVDDYDPAFCHCPDCGRDFNGSDSSGGHCMACHESFRSLGTFDRHRVGPYEPTGLRRCLTPDEMTAKGWHADEQHVWRLPAPDVSPWKKDPS